MGREFGARVRWLVMICEGKISAHNEFGIVNRIMGDSSIERLHLAANIEIDSHIERKY